MKFGNLLKTVGGGIVKQFFPIAGPVIDLINAALPEDKKLPEEATGDQIQEAIKTLPVDKQAEILGKKIDVEMAEIKAHVTNTSTLAKADIAGASTRPDIAMLFAKAVVFIDCLMALILGFAVWEEQIDISAAWPMALALTVPLLSVIGTYFGKRTKEKVARYEASTGVSLGSIGKLVKAFRK